MELALDVQLRGHAFLAPPGHQKPGGHGWHGSLSVPYSPALQKHACGLALCGGDTELAVQLNSLPPMQYAFDGHRWQLLTGPWKPRSQTQSLALLDMAGAVDFGGHSPMMPPEQNSPMLHGEQGVPRDALPR